MEMRRGGEQQRERCMMTPQGGIETSYGIRDRTQLLAAIHGRDMDSLLQVREIRSHHRVQRAAQGARVGVLRLLNNQGGYSKIGDGCANLGREIAVEEQDEQGGMRIRGERRRVAAVAADQQFRTPSVEGKWKGLGDLA